MSHEMIDLCLRLVANGHGDKRVQSVGWESSLRVFHRVPL